MPILAFITPICVFVMCRTAAGRERSENLQKPYPFRPAADVSVTYGVDQDAQMLHSPGAIESFWKSGHARRWEPEVTGQAWGLNPRGARVESSLFSVPRGRKAHRREWQALRPRRRLANKRVHLRELCLLVEFGDDFVVHMKDDARFRAFEANESFSEDVAADGLRDVLGQLPTVRADSLPVASVREGQFVGPPLRRTHLDRHIAVDERTAAGKNADDVGASRLPDEPPEVGHSALCGRQRRGVH